MSAEEIDEHKQFVRRADREDCLADEKIVRVAEICGGVGMLVPALRRVAGIGLIALLLAVFPANVYMAVDAARFAAVGPAWVFWLRLPLQFLLIWFVVRSALMPHRPEANSPH